MLHRGSLVLALSLFLTVLWLASGQSAWMAFAQGPIPTVPTVPTVPPPPGPGGPGAASSGEPSGPPLFRYVVPGKAIFGMTSLTFAPGLFPTAAPHTLITWDYSSSAVPSGSMGGGFRAPGDNNIGLFVLDPNNQMIRTFPSPGFRLCFTVNAAALEQTPASNRVIEWWNGSKWVSLDTAISDPVDGTHQMCAPVPQY